MSQQVRDVFPERLDDDQPLWQHMGFLKFLDIVQQSSLTHIRIPKFSDPLETNTPKGLTVPDGEWPPEPDAENEHTIKFTGVDTLQDLLDIYVKHSYVTCWHASNYESYAMWKVYGYTDRSIGIRTTVGDLKKAIKNADNGGEETVFISPVEYLNYGLNWEQLNEQTRRRVNQIVERFTDSGEQLPPFAPALFKHQHYEYEREVRTIVVNESNVFADMTNNLSHVQEFNDVNKIGIDIDELVDSIYLSPDLDSDSWEADTIRTYLDGNHDISVSGADVYTSSIGELEK